MNMQRTAEKWVYVAARAPNAKDPSAILSSRKIPKADRTWILGLRGHNINNAAAAVIDYRTGEVLAYVGSASYTSKGNKKFQPQFDVLADGWRQPGSAIKPIDYAIGIDDKTLTASTMFMDVDDELRRRVHPDPGRQARARAGPAPRGAPVLAQHPGHQGHASMQGLDHTFDRTKDFGLSYPSGACPCCRWASGPSRSIRSTCSAPTARSPTAASDAAPGHRPDHRLERQGRSGRRPTARRRGRRSSAPRRPTSSPTSWPATPTRRSTRSGASGPSSTARTGDRPPTRPVPPATTATSPRTGSSPHRPTRTRRPSRSGSGWATATTRPTTASSRWTPRRRSGRPSCARSPRARRSPASSRRKDIQTATVDAFTGLRPGPFTTRKTVKEFFVPGHGPQREGDAPCRRHDRRRQRPPVAGRLPGPEGHPRVLQPVGRRVQLPGLAAGQRGVGRPGRQRLRRRAAGRRAPEPPTSTTARSRRSAEAGVRRSCQARCARKYTPPVFCDPFAQFDPFATAPPCVQHPPGPDKTPRPFNTPKPTRTPKPN